MLAEVTPHTLDEIAEDYQQAVLWVQQAGFPVDRGRIAEYQKIISTLCATFPTEGWGNLDEPLHRERVCTALLEIRELVSIFKGLSGIGTSEALTGLKHYLKGPVLQTHEDPNNSSNRPRNLGFELYLNALFAYAGIEPTYGSGADLTFSYAGRCYFVEAKRPLSGPAAETAARVAKRQLVTRLDSDGNGEAFGLVAFDLSKVINPENKVMPVRDEAHLFNLMYAEDKRQMQLLSGQILRNAHPRVVGVLLHYRMLTNFSVTGALNTLKWIGWVPFSEEPSLYEIGERLGKVVRLIC
jgi:hypothetical protein